MKRLFTSHLVPAEELRVRLDPEYLHEKAVAYLERKYKKLSERYPLFAWAGILNQVVRFQTVEGLVAEWLSFPERQLLNDLRFYHRALWLRYIYGVAAGKDALADADEYVSSRSYIRDGAFLSDCWRGFCKKAGVVFC